jgi:preprotein translocase subunit SecF
MEIFKNNTTFDFMKKRKPFLGLSLVFVLCSFLLISFKGLNFGIDFNGGTLIQLQYKNNIKLEDIRTKLNNIPKYNNSTITTFGNDNEILIKVSNTTTNIDKDIGDELQTILKSTGSFEIRRVDMVGPKVGNELREKGLIALVLSLFIILIYVSFRFEWKFAVTSIFALIHDVIIAIGFLALFEIDINLDILAAILTILGYSLNDTIIVFDRIREGVKTSKSNQLDEVINESISKTLSRTTLTSLTTFFVVLTLFLFGGEIIHGFSFTLLVGVVVGTYSSIFIASSFLSILKFSISDYRTNEAQKEKDRKDKERIRKLYENGRM